MRIGIDVNTAAGEKVGTGNYTYELVRHLVKLDADNEYYLFFRRRTMESNPLRDLTNSNVQKVTTDAPLTNLYHQVGLPPRLSRHNIDVYHSPGFFVPLLWPGTKVVTIHDLNFIRFQSCWWWPGTRLSYIALRLQTPISARVASKIITVSEHSKLDIVNLLGVPPDKVAVIHSGVSSSAYLRPSHDDIRAFRESYGTTPFLLYVGVVAPHKNLHRLIEAFRDLSANLDLPVRLIVAGKPTVDKYQCWLEEIVESYDLCDRVVFTNYVSDKTLRVLFQETLGLVHPSLAEGFGLPVVEAMACGTPVIASRSSALPEIAGEAALYVDPYNVSSIKDAMHRLVIDRWLREDLVNKGKGRAAQFSWRRAAEKTLAVFEEVGKAGFRT